MARFNLFKHPYIAFLLVIALAVSFFLKGPGGLLRHNKSISELTVIIKPGTHLTQIAGELVDKGALKYRLPFLAGVIFSGNKSKLKAGEYLIPVKATPLDIVKLIASGKVIVHKLTFPEGVTVVQVIKILKEEVLLEGEITQIPEEGELLPETYTFCYGDNRQNLLNQMKKAMDKTLQELWEKRASDLPIQSPREALILASIVEKESGYVAERARIANVFFNRLRLNMRLQSDPTVIYGLTKGQSILERELTRNDLKVPSEHNTYIINGLPPTPIACPGRDALQAVLNPLPSDDLYFVANGSGGHTFTKSLQDHNKEVLVWRSIKKQKNILPQ